MTRRSSRALGLLLIGSALSLGAGWLAVRGVDLEETGRILGGTHVTWLILAPGILVAQVSIRSLRWAVLLPPASGHRLPIRRVLPPTLVGYLGNAVLPARLGEPLRAAILAKREDLAVSETFGSVVLERVLDTLALAALGVGVALLLGAPGWTLNAALLGSALSAAALVVIGVVAYGVRGRSGAGLPSPLRAVARHASRLLHGARVAERPPAIAAVIGLSLVAWLLDATLFWIAGRAIGVELTLPAAALVSVVAVLSTAVPSAPGYVGTFHLAAAAAAGVVGVDPERALALAVLAHAAAVVPMAVAGAIAGLMLGVRTRLRLDGPVVLEGVRR